MKSLFRNLVIYTGILFFLPYIIPGFAISGGAMTFLIGGVALTLFFLIIKPILNLISLPINLFTMGLFSLFTNGIIMYLLTVFVPSIQISPFSYHRMDIYGFVIPAISFNTFFAYIYASFVLSFIESFIKWLIV